MHEEKIISKLVNCQPFYRELVKDYTTLYTLYASHEVLNKELLEKEFKAAVFKKFADDLGKDLGVDTESIYGVLENLNLHEYLRA